MSRHLQSRWQTRSLALALACLKALMVQLPLAHAQTPTPSTEPLTSATDRRRYERDLTAAISRITNAGPPAVIVRVQRDGWLFERALGVADRRTNRAVRLNTPWRIASVTKLVTAHVIVDLARLGFLSLDDRLRTFMPRAPRQLGAIPIRALLGHTSGLAEYLPSPLFGATATDLMRTLSKPSDDVTEAAINRALQTAAGPAPRVLHQYANTNYVLLEKVAEAATGLSFEKLVAELVSKPAGLSPMARVVGPRARPRSNLGAAAARAPNTSERLMRGYVRADLPHRPYRDTEHLHDVSGHGYFAGGDGGLIANARDISKAIDFIWQANTSDGRPLAALTQRMTFDREGLYRYGYGVMEYALPCGVKIYGHEGFDFGVVTFAFADRANTRQLVLAVNLSLDENRALDDAIHALRETVFCR